MFFSQRTLKWVCRKTKETNGWKIKRNWTLSGTDTPLTFCQLICHFQLISVVKMKKNVAIDKKSSFIFCTQFGAQNAGNGISKLPDFKILWGSMPPDPPRLREGPLFIQSVILF